ncbi:MAG: P-II family nitrogen regulator [Candidatus Omnitrophica bacterium]|nr:P-II family nitrogen regulator [Candidatus Omnitrophota bacterium]
MTDRQQDIEVRQILRGEFEHRHATAPGLLRLWTVPESESFPQLKEVIAIIRPERWQATKTRVQRLRLSACTHHRALGRGRERGLRYLPRQQAAGGVRVRYLPKRLISWIVEETHVEPLVQAIIEVNRTGGVGDGKIFILPVEETIRLRTGDRGTAALRSAPVGETLVGANHAAWQ